MKKLVVAILFVLFALSGAASALQFNTTEVRNLNESFVQSSWDSEGVQTNNPDTADFVPANDTALADIPTVNVSAEMGLLNCACSQDVAIANIVTSSDGDIIIQLNRGLSGSENIRAVFWNNETYYATVFFAANGIAKINIPLRVDPLKVNVMDFSRYGESQLIAQRFLRASMG
jgi:hypothetical protein